MVNEHTPLMVEESQQTERRKELVGRAGLSCVGVEKGVVEDKLQSAIDGHITILDSSKRLDADVLDHWDF